MPFLARHISQRPSFSLPASKAIRFAIASITLANCTIHGAAAATEVVILVSLAVGDGCVRKKKRQRQRQKDEVEEEVEKAEQKRVSWKEITYSWVWL